VRRIGHVEPGARAPAADEGNRAVCRFGYPPSLRPRDHAGAAGTVERPGGVARRRFIGCETTLFEPDASIDCCRLENGLERACRDLPAAAAAWKRLDARRVASPPHRVARRSHKWTGIDPIAYTEHVEELAG
jgi:hypothetical protein